MLANPFNWQRFGFARSYRLHRRWIDGEIGALELGRMGFCPAEIDALFRLRARVLAALPSLAGVDIVCSCAVKCRWCHGDTLRNRSNAVIPSDIVPY